MTGKRYLAMVPAITLVVGAVILVRGHWERQRVTEEIKELFTDHVESVASLIKEGADEAAMSTALMYDLTEEHLLTTAHLFAATRGLEHRDEGLLRDEDWKVKVVLEDDGTATGDWGEIPESERQAFLERMMEAGQGELVDDGPVGDLDLLCLFHSVPDGRAIICRDAERLSELRRTTGIGPMLKGVIQRDVLYVALQDAEGVLAVAPSTELVSKWAADPWLEETLSKAAPVGSSRLRNVNGRVIFEGLIPFEMADESVVLLRVGIDASKLMEIQETSKRRYTALVALVAGIFLFVTFLTWMAWRWQSRREEIELSMALQEEQRKHWETIGQMAATVAHEVRNPLNTVNMAAQRLAQEFDVPADERPEFDEMIGVLQTEAKRVGRVVTEFLDLGKPLLLARAQVDAGDAVNEACAPMSMRARSEGKELTIDNRCDGKVDMDPARFRQMMANLIDNALDAVSPGGRVEVRASCADGGLSVQISDDGPGLTSEQVAEVLKPFVSFKSSGTGLGLPLVKRLVEAHGGSFELTSALGKGTAAAVFIPSSKKEK